MSNKNNTTTSVPRQPYIRIPKKLKLEIRKQYELGIDLLILAREHKLNYGTLKNCASNEGWIKGSTVEVVYQREREIFVDDLAQMRAKELRKIITISSIYTEETLEDALLGIEPTKARSEALLNREKVLTMQQERTYKLFSIRDDHEEREYQVLEQKLKKIKAEVDKEEIVKSSESEEFRG